MNLDLFKHWNAAGTIAYFLWPKEYKREPTVYLSKALSGMGKQVVIMVDWTVKENTDGMD